MSSSSHEIEHLAHKLKDATAQTKPAFAAARPLEKSQEYYASLTQSDRGKFLKQYYQHYEQLNKKIYDMQKRLQEASNETERRAFANELRCLNEELAAFARQLLALQNEIVQTNTTIEKDRHLILKKKYSTLEDRVQIVCALLGQPSAIVKTTAVGKTGTSQQPLIENSASYATILMDEVLMAQIEKHMDTQDRQYKILLQGLIGAWDLHPANAMVELQLSEDPEGIAKEKFQYFDTEDPQNPTWKEVNLFELLCLKIFKKISDDTIVRHSATLQISCSLALDKSLQNALHSPWKVKVVLFDNARTLGGEKMAQLGNLSCFNLFRNEPCLACRCFFLGTPLASEPLTIESQSYLQQLSKQKNLITNILSVGNSSVFNKLEKTTQNDLKKYFESPQFYFTTAALCGKKEGVEELFNQLPEMLSQKVVTELLENKLISSQEDKELLAEIFAYGIFPVIDPGERRALIGRIEVAKKYVAESKKALLFLSRKKALAEKLLRKAVPAEKLIATINETAALIIDDHLPFEKSLAYKASTTLLKKELQEALQKPALTEELYQKIIKFFLESKALLEPTFYGLYCRMYPHFNFILDLLVQINAKLQKRDDLSFQDFEMIRNELLQEKRFISLPKNGVIQEFIIATPCRKIIDEALALNIITATDARYQACMNDMKLCRARNGK